METNRAIKVTLVHGTWGRGFFDGVFLPKPGRKRRWFEPESPFSVGLRTALMRRGLDATIDSFPWSGENSLTARATAADELLAIMNADTVLPRVVIAHSHGGNIAASACGRVEAGNVLLITLATPFIALSRTNDAAYSDRMRMALEIAFICFNTSVLLKLARIIGLSGFLIVLAASFYLRHKVKALIVKRIPFASRRPVGFKSKVPILCIRTPHDEAHLALMATAIGSQLVRLAMKLIPPLFAVGILIVGLTGLYVGKTYVDSLPPITPSNYTIGGNDGPRLADYPPGKLWIDLVLVVASMPPALIVFIFIGGMFHAANGTELLHGGFLHEIDVTMVPPDSHQVTKSLKAESGSPGLRHSIHRHPECAETCAAWIDDALRSLDDRT